MIRILALIACLAPTTAFAQANAGPPADMGAAHRMMHGQSTMTPGQQMMHGQMMQGRHMMPAHMMDRQQPSGAFATHPGQGAFAAI